MNMVIFYLFHFWETWQCFGKWNFIWNKPNGGKKTKGSVILYIMLLQNNMIWLLLYIYIYIYMIAFWDDMRIFYGPSLIYMKVTIILYIFLNLKRKRNPKKYFMALLAQIKVVSFIMITIHLILFVFFFFIL